MIIASGLVILISSLFMFIGGAWLALHNIASDAFMMGVLLLACASAGLGVLLIAIGIMAG